MIFAALVFAVQSVKCCWCFSWLMWFSWFIPVLWGHLGMQ